MLAGDNVLVTGNGSLGTPYIVSADGLIVQDEDVEISADAGQLDFQGAGVTATLGTGEVIVTIPGYTDEQARDAIGAALVAGAGISIVVDDPNDTITVTNTIPAYTDEEVRDVIGAALVAGAGISIVVDDPGDTITIASTTVGVGTLTVQDENVEVETAVTQIDFQGSGVVATSGASEVIVTVRGFSTRAVATTQALPDTDEVVLASDTINLTLPAVGLFVGNRLTIKNVDVGVITITPASGTIDGAASKTLTVQYSSVDLVTDGTDWWEI